MVGRPLNPIGLLLFGAPRHAWRELVSKLMGNVVGSLVEVDPKTISKEELRYKVKVFKDRGSWVPQSVVLCMKNFQFLNRIEEIWVVISWLSSGCDT